jgi:hypothetical protein
MTMSETITRPVGQGYQPTGGGELPAIPTTGSGVMPAPAPRPPRAAVESLIPVYDSAKFEHMQRIATIMANSPIVPATLRGVWVGQGSNKSLKLFEPEQRFANCFQVVNQAHNWGMDPFAVAQACSIVHDRLMFEGKLVYAVIQAKLGVSLGFEWNGETGKNAGIRVWGPDGQFGEPREVRGTVATWESTGANSPWSKAQQAHLQLAYRGAREWCRLYEPALLLGVYTPDEMDDVMQESRARAAVDVTPRAAVNYLADDDAPAIGQRLQTEAAANAGLQVDRETGEVTAPEGEDENKIGGQADDSVATVEEPDWRDYVLRFTEEVVSLDTIEDVEAELTTVETDKLPAGVHSEMMAIAESRMAEIRALLPAKPTSKERADAMAYAIRKLGTVAEIEAYKDSDEAAAFMGDAEVDQLDKDMVVSTFEGRRRLLVGKEKANAPKASRT